MLSVKGQWERGWTGRVLRTLRALRISGGEGRTSGSMPAKDAAIRSTRLDKRHASTQGGGLPRSP